MNRRIQKCLLSLLLSVVSGAAIGQDKYEEGMFLWVIDEVGAKYDDVKLRDNTAPPFSLDAHIRANSRYKNFTVGGLVWSGLLKLEEPGTYNVRVTTDVDINESANWKVVCESSGIIAGLPIGEGKELKYYDNTGRKTQRVFEGRVKIPKAGAHKFAFRLRCRDRIAEKLNKWKFVQRHYSYVNSRVEILAPSDSSFRPLSSFDVIRKVN